MFVDCENISTICVFRIINIMHFINSFPIILKSDTVVRQVALGNMFKYS